MFPALGAVLGLLHPVAGGVLRRGLKFQSCKNTLNIFFNNSGNFWVPPRISQLLRNMKVYMVMQLPLCMLLWPEDSLMSNRNMKSYLIKLAVLTGRTFLTSTKCWATCTQDVQFAGHKRKVYGVRQLKCIIT